MTSKLSQAQKRFLSEILSTGLDPDTPQWFEIFPREKATVEALRRVGLLETGDQQDDNGDTVPVCRILICPGDTEESLRAQWDIPEFME